MVPLSPSPPLSLFLSISVVHRTTTSYLFFSLISLLPHTSLSLSTRRVKKCDPLLYLNTIDRIGLFPSSLLPTLPLSMHTSHNSQPLSYPPLCKTIFLPSFHPPSILHRCLIPLLLSSDEPSDNRRRLVVLEYSLLVVVMMGRRTRRTKRRRQDHARNRRRKT